MKQIKEKIEEELGHKIWVKCMYDITNALHSGIYNNTFNEIFMTLATTILVGPVNEL